MASLPLLAVDIGNSSTKLGLLDQAWPAGTLPAPSWVHAILPKEVGFQSAGDMDELAGKMPALLRWRVASVHRERERQLAEWVQRNRPQDDYRLLTYRDLPLDVHVDHPERVGLDRLAAAVGANMLREPGRPAVVVSAGSAVTVNLIAADGAFEGGVILPGFRMSALALAGADLLPEVLFQSANEPPPVLGKNTEAAIRSGLFWGTVGAVREIIMRFDESLVGEGTALSHPQIFITGGDLQRLAPLVADHAQFVPHLVLAGIAVAWAREN